MEMKDRIKEEIESLKEMLQHSLNEKSRFAVNFAISVLQDLLEDDE